MDAKGQYYDVIVVGAGIGGLIAGALASAGGYDVLVVDKNDTPGGYFAGIVVDGCRVDCGIMLLSGVAGDGPLVQLANELSLIMPPLTALPVLGNARGNGYDISLVADAQRFAGEVAAEFNVDRGAIDRFIGLGQQALADMRKDGSITPLVAQLATTTYQQVVADYIADHDARSFFLENPFFLFEPDDAALIPILRLHSLLSGDIYIADDGVHEIIDLLLESVVSHGGTFLPGHEVVRIEAGSEHKAISCSNGAQARGKALVVDMDLQAAFRLLRPEPPESIVRRLSRLKAGPSALCCHMKVAGNPLSQMGVDGRMLSVVDPLFSDSLWPRGVNCLMLNDKHIVIEAETEFAGEPGPGALFAEKCHEFIERTGAGVLSTVVTGPTDFQRMTGNALGSTTGWKNTPQAMMADWHHPLPGIYVVSHWAGPWSGMIGGIKYGAKAAEAIRRQLS